MRENSYDMTDQRRSVLDRIIEAASTSQPMINRWADLGTIKLVVLWAYLDDVDPIWALHHWKLDPTLGILKLPKPEGG